MKQGRTYRRHRFPRRRNRQRRRRRRRSRQRRRRRCHQRLLATRPLTAAPLPGPSASPSFMYKAYSMPASNFRRFIAHTLKKPCGLSAQSNLSLLINAYAAFCDNADTPMARAVGARTLLALVRFLIFDWLKRLGFDFFPEKNIFLTFFGRHSTKNRGMRSFLALVATLLVATVHCVSHKKPRKMASQKFSCRFKMPRKRWL